MTGETLNHYKILEPLGKGGMGEVWVAEDTRLGRRVALKVLPEDLATDPERLARFEREARVLASLNHPNIVTIYSVEESGSRRFITMELVEGQTLRQSIPVGGLDTDKLLDYATAIAEAVGGAHDQGVTHRDLKPDNVLISNDGRIKVLDFGLAKALQTDVTSDSPTQLRSDTVTRQGSLLGTVAYMSPEQAQGKPVDSRSDVFSLGILIHEMATGQRPFDGDNTVSILSAILRDQPQPVSGIKPALPNALERVVGRCLDKEPQARYPSARELATDLRSVATAPNTGGLRSRLPWFAGAAVLLAVAGIAWFAGSRRGDAPSFATTLPEIERIADNIQFLEEGPECWQAWRLASQLSRRDLEDPRLGELLPRFQTALDIVSEPAGAMVSIKYYGDPDGEWIPLGQTPLAGVEYPRGFTRIRFELAGHDTVHDLVSTFFEGDELSYRLHAEGELPEGMVYVPAGEDPVISAGLRGADPEPVAAFLIDRHEVTNRDFKAFVDAGGYQQPEYWTEGFAERFVDRTGRPGPATWEVGDYASGRDDFPVTGVSWYEAAAYAVWAGKRLPTLFHWNRAAAMVTSNQVIPLSNLGGHEGPVAVGTTDGMNRFGAYDMAGNVREWTLNRGDDSGVRFILGGGFSDPDYQFNYAYAESPFDRTPTNGFRCIRLVDDEPNLAGLSRTIDRISRDFLAETPVSDDVFRVFLRQFEYDHAPLEPEIEAEVEVEDGLRQRITFNAAYGDERMIAYLYLPANAEPPYRAVVIYPGSGAMSASSSESIELGRADFILKSGRAVLYPIYKWTYDRRGRERAISSGPSNAYRENVVMWGKDVSRAIDYLEQRDDIDSDKLGYFGTSWGAVLGGIFPAIEPRITVNVLYSGGLRLDDPMPEADPFHYVPRVTQPTLMLNGEHDFFFPVETSQRPMFELLGTPDDRKVWSVHPGGHSVPRADMIREALEWYDRWLGAVN